MAIPRLRPGLALLLATLVCGAAATGLEAQRRGFTSTVEMVPLTVTVTDARGQYVKSLGSADFAVLEDGVPQPLTFFASDPVPMDLALVVDVSSSMHVHLPLVQRAARGLVRTLRDQDRATVVALTHTLGVPQPLTHDRALVESAIQRLVAHGGTSLFDGMYIVLRELQRARAGASEVRKQVVVLLSDGLDSSSRLGFEDVQTLAAQVGVNVYVIAMPGVGPEKPRNRRDGALLQAEYVMKALARDAGGRAFFPQAVRELPAIYDDIARELSNQYELAYVSSRPAADEGFRRVTVRVANAVTRTRTGYYATARSRSIGVSMPDAPRQAATHAPE